MANLRTKARIEARIRERVAYCIEFELSDPRAAFLTITRVELTQDLSLARVYYSVFGTAGERGKVQHMLDDATGFIRRAVARVLQMRRVPKLAFFYDDSIAFQDEMERKISAALDSDREINPQAHDELADVPDDPPAPD